MKKKMQSPRARSATLRQVHPPDTPGVPKLGRPFLPPGKAKSVQIIFRVEPELHERIVAAAEQQGKPMATWIRDTLDGMLRSK